MKLPIITNSTSNLYPADNKCPYCKTDISEPNSFLYLSGGALKKDEEGDFIMDDDLYGFLDLRFQGAFETGKGKHRDKYVDLEIVKSAEQGQFSLSFCSTKCFRKFIDEMVQHLEEELKMQ